MGVFLATARGRACRRGTSPGTPRQRVPEAGDFGCRDYDLALCAIHAAVLSGPGESADVPWVTADHVQWRGVATEFAKPHPGELAARAVVQPIWTDGSGHRRYSLGVPLRCRGKPCSHWPADCEHADLHIG